MGRNPWLEPRAHHALFQKDVRLRAAGASGRRTFHAYDVRISRAAKKEPASGTPSDNGFKAFWEQYHEITRKDKVNPGKARKVWNKLSAGERIAALENIETYYYHLNNTLFCLQAVNYLSHKAFLNEYEYEY